MALLAMAYLQWLEKNQENSNRKRLNSNNEAVGNKRLRNIHRLQHNAITKLRAGYGVVLITAKFS
jgi:hypothetical protein